jgi:hypothetical protein
MQATANERLVRQIAREVALEAMARIRARLREVAADEFATRIYEAEWDADGRTWPTAAMPAREWVPYLLADLSQAEAEFERCRR